MKKCLFFEILFTGFNKRTESCFRASPILAKNTILTGIPIDATEINLLTNELFSQRRKNDLIK